MPSETQAATLAAAANTYMALRAGSTRDPSHSRTYRLLRLWTPHVSNGELQSGGISTGTEYKVHLKGPQPIRPIFEDGGFLFAVLCLPGASRESSSSIVSGCQSALKGTLFPCGSFFPISALHPFQLSYFPPCAPRHICGSPTRPGSPCRFRSSSSRAFYRTLAHAHAHAQFRISILSPPTPPSLLLDFFPWLLLPLNAWLAHHLHLRTTPPLSSKTLAFLLYR
jgi:hypothetical protein